MDHTIKCAQLKHVNTNDKNEKNNEKSNRNVVLNDNVENEKDTDKNRFTMFRI